MDWTQISFIAAVLLTITTVILNSFGILGKIFSFIGSAWGYLKNLVHHSEPSNSDIPSRTIVVIQQPGINALWWSKGTAGEQQIMQVVGDFNLTNTWSKNIRLSGAVLRYKRLFFFSSEVRGDASVKDLRSQYSGNYPVPPNEMTWLRISFHFAPKSNFPTTNFIADVAVIDQFNNHHWLTNLCFKHPNAMTF